LDTAIGTRLILGFSNDSAKSVLPLPGLDEIVTFVLLIMLFPVIAETTTTPTLRFAVGA
jgi:hypothetical protein